MNDFPSSARSDFVVTLHRRRVPHTIPVDDHNIHVADADCWCHPLRQEVRNLAGEVTGHLMIHNAADCREKYQRQGIATGQPWQLVVAVEVSVAGVTSAPVREGGLSSPPGGLENPPAQGA